MRRLLLPVLLGPHIVTIAQPVLEYANVQVMGNTYPVHLVTDPGSSDPNPDGANVTWDFSSATLQLNAGSTTFLQPASTPYAAIYPSSNLAQSVTLPGSTTYTYFNLQPAQLDMLAEGIGGTDEKVYTDPKTPLQFPFAYPEWFIDYYAYDGSNYSVSRAYMGYGTVILPTGTYTNVVKIASTSGAIDFYTSNPVRHLVNIEDDGVVLVFGDAITGVAEASSHPALACYPIPTTDVLNITGLHSAGTWQLLDAQGHIHQNGRHVPGMLSLDLSTLPTGPYILLVSDPAGRRSVKVSKL